MYLLAWGFMLSNNAPFKLLSRAFINGLYNLSHGGEITPPTPPEGYWFLINDSHDYLIDNDGNYLIVTAMYNVIDDEGNQIIDNDGNFLITQQ